MIGGNETTDPFLEFFLDPILEPALDDGRSFIIDFGVPGREFVGRSLGVVGLSLHTDGVRDLGVCLSGGRPPDIFLDLT